MRITSFGLFWRANEIEWWPGQGNKKIFQLLGRVGQNRPTIKVADFRSQQGIYILFDEYGPSYVGLTREQGLGKRLKDHMGDHLKGTWDRFSWFGFKEIGVPREDGTSDLLDLKEELTEKTNTTIADLEALLIRAIGPKNNLAWMQFKEASEWTQVGWDERDKYMARLKQ